MRPTQPSLPPSEPSHSRHLGAGSRGDRAVRAQLIIALVALLVMVAVPLYLLRRPRVDAKDKDGKAADGKAIAGSANALSGLSPLAPTPGTTLNPPTPSGQTAARGLTVGDPRILRCSKGSNKPPPEQCDRQPFFEEALVKAIRDNASCVNTSTAGATVNFVLDVDFKRKKSHAWPGKSGSLKRKMSKEVVACVNRALPTPEWSQVPHQHDRYQIAVLATYPGGSTAPADTGQ
jgi:hypothetical protein